MHAGKKPAESNDLTHSAKMVAYLNSLFHRRHRQAKVVACASHKFSMQEVFFKALVTGKLPQVAYLIRQPVKELVLPVGG